MKIKAVSLGVMNVLMPIPMFILTVLMMWFWEFGICIGLLGLNTIPFWTLYLEVLPMLISPLAGIFGIVYGVIRYKERLAWLGILLSLLCLVENGLIWYGVFYIGSRF